MKYKSELIDRPLQPMVTIHTHSAVQDLPQVLGQSYQSILQYLGEIGQHPAGAPFVAYHNMDMQNLDIEVGFPTPGELLGKDTIQAGKIPAGKAASCLYVGPYSTIGAAYDSLTRWMSDQGLEGTGVCYEIYLTDPTGTAPDAQQTQIVMPLKTN